jgi:hypothetical protein
VIRTLLLFPIIAIVALTLKHFSKRPVSRSPRYPRARVVMDGTVKGTHVFIDGHEVTRVVSHVAIHHRAGQMPELELRVIGVAVDAIGEPAVRR